ncbi:MAG: type II toxin-antitoxin system RelE/ParE family toxin [Proteobacteria bacterium]|nr:type II toxin-antitoxin system RelE/ParE family toxin [Pseudomonadota bacterium]MBU1399162.1 type II toxin-antitoxin system RelE/ParE family toxin [Pseudomonadota bacterium]MBU1568997.1 type II toxin-antitoxin system RelE/ParE family toxin [Pseudomonadota bacterium]
MEGCTGALAGVETPARRTTNDKERLKGKRKDTLAVKVSGNWRVTFKLKNENVFEVNYEDYH